MASSPTLPIFPSTGEDLYARAVASKNRTAGILLHRVLEVWVGQPTTPATLLRELAREQASDARAVDLARKRLETISRSETLRRIFAAETHGRE